MKKLGRFKYTGRKQDFQLEDDLPGNLRKLKPLGSDQLLQDRFDSIFRRNMIEMDAPTQNEKLRQRKAKFKMVDKIGSRTQDLYYQNMELKKKNDAKEKGAKEFSNKNNVIII